MVTENTPYRNKKYIVEDLGFDTKFKTEKEIQSLEIKRDNAYGEFGMPAVVMRMRELTTYSIRCRITWEFILHLFHSVTTDHTHSQRSSRQFMNCHTGTTQVPVILYNKSIQNKFQNYVSNINQPHRHTKNRIQRLGRLDNLELCFMDRRR